MILSDEDDDEQDAAGVSNASEGDGTVLNMRGSLVSSTGSGRGEDVDHDAGDDDDDDDDYSTEDEEEVPHHRVHQDMSVPVVSI